MTGPATTFVRDRFTWMAYLLLAYYAYLQAAMGPLMPFLREELGLSYTAGGFHFSAFALGMIGAGVTADNLVARLGRRRVFWGGAAGMAAGALGLVMGDRLGFTVLSAFVMGFMGSLLLVVIQAALSDRYGRQRAVALTEANVAASIGATSVPLLIGVFAAAGLGWRGALLFAVGALVVLAVRYRGVTIPELVSDEEVGSGNSPSRSRLPAAYWAYWTVLVVTVAIEWSLVFWGADFMAGAIGLSKSAAASAMSAFFLAMVLGRYAGSRLARRLASETLLMGFLLVALAGFCLFWLTRLAPLNVLALFIAGLGIANLYPLILALATGVAPRLANVASARISLGTGLSILIAPLALGWLADRTTISQAFAVVLVLFVVAGVVTWGAAGGWGLGARGKGTDHGADH